MSTKNKPLPRILFADQLADLMRPIKDALIAGYMGRFQTRYCHTLAGALYMAQTIANEVERHRHLLDVIQPGADAINAIMERYNASTVKPELWTARASEIRAIDGAMDIYAALLQTTPPKVIRRVAMGGV